MKFKTPLKEQTMVKKHRARKVTATAREHGLNRTRERTQEIRGKKSNSQLLLSTKNGALEV